MLVRGPGILASAVARSLLAPLSAKAQRPAGYSDTGKPSSMPAVGSGRSFTSGRLRIGSRGAEFPQESSFTILFQNCPERQSPYERPSARARTRRRAALPALTTLDRLRAKC